MVNKIVKIKMMTTPITTNFNRYPTREITPQLTIPYQPQLSSSHKKHISTTASAHQLIHVGE